MASEGQSTSAVEPGSVNALDEGRLQTWLSAALQLGHAAAAPTISKFNTGQVRLRFFVSLYEGYDNSKGDATPV